MKHTVDPISKISIDSIFASLTILYKGRWDDFYVDVQNPTMDKTLIVDNLLLIDSSDNNPVVILSKPDRAIVPPYGSVSCRFGIPPIPKNEDRIYTNYWKLTYQGIDAYAIIQTRVLIKDGTDYLTVDPIKIDTVQRGKLTSVAVTIRNSSSKGIALDLPEYDSRTSESIAMRDVQTLLKFPVYIPAKDSILIPFTLDTEGMNGNFIRSVKLTTSQEIANQYLPLAFKPEFDSKIFSEILLRQRI